MADHLMTRTNLQIADSFRQFSQFDLIESLVDTVDLTGQTSVNRVNTLLDVYKVGLNTTDLVGKPFFHRPQMFEYYLQSDFFRHAKDFMLNLRLAQCPNQDYPAVALLVAISARLPIDVMKPGVAR